MSLKRDWRSRAWLAVAPTALLLAACATSSPSRDVVVDHPTSAGIDQVSADHVFETADSDADGYLMPVDVERLGLGGNWHTLDADGSGRVSRPEFRDQFAAPLIQATLRLPGDIENAQPLVSSEFLLPPEPPAQRYVPAPVTAPTPASMTMPFNAPLVIPVLIDDQEAAALDEASKDTEADTSDTDMSLPSN
ncbi:hypothetical protein [Salinicola socius]|uniref:hypothetical protein n=1 Tax=Salinicola socius TaxID=404433 RepID=UPI0013A622E5|nr:hypothetical protein [Salinicola socius]